MSNYRKTMTEALQEMKPLNERMRMGRQLINPNKEVMVVKKNKVVVIDKKDQDKYMKQGWELAEEVELDESVIDKVKEIASKKQAKKIGGVMVDSFTASAISQIYDKVNDANKKKMEKLPITKLANLAFKMMQKNEFVPEEVGLDEGTKQVLAHGGKGQYKAVRDGSITKVMYKGKVVGTADFDRGADSFFASIKGEKGQKSFDDAQAMVDYFAKNKITEEYDLAEGKKYEHGIGKVNSAFEIGTPEYRQHTQSITPGQEITDYQQFKVQSMKEALAKVWGLDEAKKEEKDLTKKVKGSTMTMTGKKSDEIDTKPEIKEK